MKEEEAPACDKLSKEISPVDTMSLTIKIASSGQNPRKENIVSTKTSVSSSPLYSPSLVSPPSSAFVSALQSPYISPRANIVPSNPQDNPTPVSTSTPTTTSTHPSTPVSYSGSHSDDVPSTSYTPPPERCDFSDDKKLKIITCVPVPCSDNTAPPRISFSFPVPRISFAKGSASPATNAKLRSCDVYIGFHGQSPNLVRFCKWLKSELELQGIACFVADRAKYSDSQSHEIADRVICSVTYGVVVVSNYSFLNHLSLEEIRFFAQKKNLIPVFFGTDPNEIANLLNGNSDSKECKEAIDGLVKSHESKLEANEGNWRYCVSKDAGILRAKQSLGPTTTTAAGATTYGANLNQFFQEVEVLKELLRDLETLYNRLKSANEQSKTLHNVNSIKELRLKMDNNVASSLKKVKLIK